MTEFTSDPQKVFQYDQWNDQSLDTLRNYLKVRNFKTYLFPWHDWINKGGQSTQTIYEQDYKQTLSEKPGQTRDEYFCTICEVIDNITGDSPVRRGIGRTTSNSYTKTSGSGSQTGWSVGASATVGVQGEMVNASATVTSQFNQLKTTKQDQANNALRNATQSVEITVPPHIVTVFVQDWYKTVQTTHVEGGFDNANIDTAIDFRPDSENQYSGTSANDLLAQMQQKEPNSIHIDLVRDRLRREGLL